MDDRASTFGLGHVQDEVEARGVGLPVRDTRHGGRVLGLGGIRRL
jgi:hypothetical protein